MPLYRRIPKRGFTNRNSKTIVGINVSALERFDNEAVVTVETLLESGVIKNPRDGVKILGNGELTKKLTVKVNAFSEGAKSKIEALGGTCEGDLMFKSIRNAFKVKELRGKILYTFMMLVVIRFGSQLPIPGIETSFFADWLRGRQRTPWLF